MRTRTHFPRMMVCLISVFVYPMTGQASGTDWADLPWEHNLASALVRAQSQSQLVFVYRRESGCSSCNKMEDTLVSPEIVGELTSNLVLCLADARTGTVLDVPCCPGWIITDPTGTQLVSHWGPSTPAQFHSYLALATVLDAYNEAGNRDEEQLQSDLLDDLKILLPDDLTGLHELSGLWSRNLLHHAEVGYQAAVKARSMLEDGESNLLGRALADEITYHLALTAFATGRYDVAVSAFEELQDSTRAEYGTDKLSILGTTINQLELELLLALAARDHEGDLQRIGDMLKNKLSLLKEGLDSER